MKTLDTPEVNLIKVIFFVQIILLSLLGFLSIIGFTKIVTSLGSFLFTIVLGALGASVSLLRRVHSQKKFYDKEYQKLKIFTVLMPILYGVILSGIAYLLFMSGILSGDSGHGLLTTNLFPNFTELEDSSVSLFEQFIIIRPINMQATAKLFIWCFIAGYSERFVAGILNQLEFQVSKD